jgi:hypothetical protein
MVISLRAVLGARLRCARDSNPLRRSSEAEAVSAGDVGAVEETQVRGQPGEEISLLSEAESVHLTDRPTTSGGGGGLR